MLLQLTKLTSLALISSFLFAYTAKAEELANCYRISMPDSPADMDSMARNRDETWCYQRVSKPTDGSLFIYNIDSEEARPEMAMIIEPDGRMLHGSLLAGKTTVHQLNSTEFNPYSIPLSQPRNLMPEMRVLDATLQESSKKVFDYLITQTRSVHSLAIQTGRFSATARVTPWRGYWWPFKGTSLASPLRKYDSYVKARTGANPGALNWERTGRHVSHGLWWEGHCNGWAASSILRRQPHNPVTDSQTGITFTVADQKGLLAEADYCANTSFFGKRYRGRPGDKISDIDPVTFHKTLTYYLGTLGKPIVSDYRRDTVVDNHPVSAYTMDITRTGPGTYSVIAILRMHRYDGSRSNSPGSARSYTRTYRYTLRESSSGTLSGSWQSTNPDFFWVPLSTGDCGSNNPRLSHSWVAEIISL